jgi:hypothetical protein
MSLATARKATSATQELRPAMTVIIEVVLAYLGNDESAIFSKQVPRQARRRRSCGRQCLIDRGCTRFELGQETRSTKLALLGKVWGSTG